VHDGTMRGATLVLATICGPIMVVAGAFLIMVGVVQQQHKNGAYEIAFARPGADCGAAQLRLDTASGQPLLCTQRGTLPFGTPTVEVAGLTEPQVRDFLQLAATIGGNGLDRDEQRFLQARFDQLVATVPEDRRRFGHENPLFGWPLATAGAALVLTGAAAAITARRA
jgi:hypothetical protein